MAIRVGTFTQTAGETLDYRIDWAAILTPDSDAISTVTWTAVGLTVGATSQAGAVTTAYLSGGTAGVAGVAKCRIVTTGGRTWERTIDVHVTS